MTTRVLLVDDSWEVRERLRALLLRETDIDLVGEAADGVEAQDMLEALPVDVVVMDVNLPETSGIEIARQMLARAPGVRVIMISMQADRRYVQESLKAGVFGYVLKDCAYEELLGAIHAVTLGRRYLSAELNP